jgi:hypothetical protein
MHPLFFNSNPNEGEMTSKSYDKYSHTHVTINVPENGRCADFIEQAWEGVQEIALHTGTHVWFPGSYMHVGQHADVRQVGDGRTKGYDDDGNCIISVPAEWCKFWTSEEADCIEQARDADARLLSYAL